MGVRGSEIRVLIGGDDIGHWMSLNKTLVVAAAKNIVCVWET